MMIPILLAGLLPLTLARVVVIPGGDPRPYKPVGTIAPVKTAFEFFNGSAENEFYGTNASVLMSSLDFDEITPSDGIYASGDSFVRGAIQAWGEHLHLVIRPEEVWFTILVQLNFYMNAHAEELRDMFVNHTGQEVIYIEDYTWYDVLRRFQFAIQERVKTKWLLEWLRPNFTTTVESDIMTANILMMGLTKAYFKFEGGVVCGLPSVTLLGEEKDWVALLEKLDRLAEFGAQPKDYARRLTPILKRFARTFREPDSPEIKQFWNDIAWAHTTGICGGAPVQLSGWISGFIQWAADGKLFRRSDEVERPEWFTLDNVTYQSIDVRYLPVGYATAPFIMRDFRNVDRFEAYVAAGTMGKQIKAGVPEGYADALRRTGGNLTLLAESSKELHTTLQPLSSWMLYGPSKHNATAKKYWLDELDVAEILYKTGKVMTNMSCRAKY